MAETTRREQIRAALNLYDAEERLATFIVLLPSMTEDDFADAIAEIKEGDRKGVTFDREWELLVAQWGRLKGRVAVEDGFTRFGITSDPGFYSKMALRGWGEVAPLEAAGWLDNHPDQEDWPGCLHQLALGMARNDPDLAAAVVARSLATQPADFWVRQRSMEEIAGLVVRQTGLNGIQRWYDAIPTDADDGATKREAFFQVAHRLDHASEDEANQFLEANASQVWRNDRSYAQQTLKLAKEDPAAALGWAGGLPASPSDGSWPAPAVFSNRGSGPTPMPPGHGGRHSQSPISNQGSDRCPRPGQPSDSQRSGDR
ncbi:MAG: hypothetical protein R3F11_23085 [Verrucomicrobiales bacterium]